jgi:pilus assembly protein Flp/PilA
MEKLKKFLKKEEGVTAIEYGLIAAGIGVAIAAIVFTVGDSLNTLFTTVSNCLGGAS